jgi:hypothetical protein
MTRPSAALRFGQSTLGSSRAMNHFAALFADYRANALKVQLGNMSLLFTPIQGACLVTMKCVFHATASLFAAFPQSALGMMPTWISWSAPIVMQAPKRTSFPMRTIDPF